MSRASYLTAALFLLPSCGAEIHASGLGGRSPRWADDTEAAWQALQASLVGEFRAPVSAERSVTASYRVISNGSALVETFTSTSGKETISVYHHDRSALMLTHYCAQGNQVRLKATEASKERVVFAFLDATNVSEGQGVMQRLVFVFKPDGFNQESVYRTRAGDSEVTTLQFVRR